MTPLQKVLKATYHDAWIDRGTALGDVASALYQLQQARQRVADKQSWLERVGAELEASGYDKAHDYLTRVWPMAKPEEYILDPCAAVAD